MKSDVMNKFLLIKNIKDKIMKKIRPLIILILALTNFSIVSLNASERVSTTIELSESSINSFINEQYNRIGFVNNISGSIEGITYDITLNLPYIKLLDNAAKIEFGFKIASNILNDYISFESDVSFNIPSIEDLSVKGICESFTEKINSLSINNVLKNVIIGAWNGLQLEVYPMKLAEKIENTQWLNERAINMVTPYFSISFDFDPGKLKIDLNTFWEGDLYQVVALKKNSSIRATIKIKSSCQVDIKELHIYNMYTSLIYSGTDLARCYKNIPAEISVALNLSQAYYVVEVLYKTSNTFYLRSYSCFPDHIYYSGSVKDLN